MKLKRSISLLSLTCSSLSCMLGSGWLFGAYYAATIAGPLSLISWLLGGGLIIFIALTFSELSSMLPFAGGFARFTHITHGSTVSFSMSWLAWLSCFAVAPTEVQAILQYISYYFPWLTKLDGSVSLLTLPGFLVASLLLMLIGLINTISIKRLMRCNNPITAWKVFVPLMTAAAFLFTSFHSQNLSLTHSSQSLSKDLHDLLWSLPSAGIVFSFLGFREATSLAGEAKNPQRAIPIAVIGSVVLCTALYFLIQLAFLGAIPTKLISQGWSHLVFSNKEGPLIAIATSLGLSWLLIFIYSDALIAPFGSALIYTATTARLNYAMSKNGYIPGMLRLNKQGIPAFAVMINCFMGLLLFIPLPSWQAFVSFQSCAILLAYATGPICLLALRQQAPHLKRPFQLACPKIFASIAFYFCNLLVYWSGWQILMRLMIGFIIGLSIFSLYHYTIYLLSQHKKTSSQYLIRFLSYLFQIDVKNDFSKTLQNNPLHLAQATWLIPYFLGISLISYLGSFGGGKQIIPFGWDFAVLAIFSLFILIYAYSCRFTKALNLENQ